MNKKGATRIGLFLSLLVALTAIIGLGPMVIGEDLPSTETRSDTFGTCTKETASGKEVSKAVDCAAVAERQSNGWDCSESTAENNCADGLDNDCDGNIDNADPGCCSVERQISTDTSGQVSPDIDGNLIIWSDLITGNQDIFMCDLSLNGAAGGCLPGDAKTQITTNPSREQLPVIDGNKIVYQAFRTGSSDIFMFDLVTNTETQITTDPAGQFGPAISGDNIVWEDLRNGIPDIYMFDLVTNTETQITSGTAFQRLPAIDGNVVVWQQQIGGSLDIFMCDLSLNGAAGGCLAGDAKTQITSNTAPQSTPDIDGNKIVWSDTRTGNGDIFMCDLSLNGAAGGCLPGDAKTQITTNTAGQSNPAISGNNIVWIDNRNGNLDIFKFDLVTNTETQITTNTAFQTVPAISGDNIVWEDFRNGNRDIFLGDLTLCPLI